MEITFPTPSVDNMIFLTNFVLPAHLLANQSLEHYITTFHKSPIGSNCGKLAQTNNDPTSIVFDLGTCKDTLLKFYQVKQFGSEAELQRYILSKSNTIDMIVSSDIYPEYTRNQVILNRYLTLFFNYESPRVPKELRQEL
ncbi:MAG: hypothetical protein H6765_07565 [Candidatus Peribacteria bacterium]|nr:MAG: hypothetical protein H6765_07565 [Candidatus Peribacteria bacterium]